MFAPQRELQEPAEPARSTRSRGLTSSLFPFCALALRVDMRMIVGISLILIGTGALLCRDGAHARRDVAVAAERPAMRWVRTVDGWEQPSLWNVSAPVDVPRLHPLVVAAGQGLASALALVAFRRQD